MEGREETERGRDGNGGDAGKEKHSNRLRCSLVLKFPVCVRLFLNRCYRGGVLREGGREGERYCDRGRECAMERKHLSEGWGGCYDNYLYSGLSVMFHWSLERRGMKAGEELGKEGLERGHFSICLLSWSVNLTVRPGDKDKL